ncbi:DUF4412 domain-containing protein [Candidatus Parcubacteria bacterium]|nr:DUF4412 domain-containing protein [Candidatus Parcubacteria bacterium]
MRKKIIFVSILLLVAFILAGAGCAKKQAREKEAALTGAKEEVEEKTESLTEILSKAKSIISFKYDIIVIVPGQAAMAQKMWIKQNKMRMEMTMEGRNMVYLTDSDKQTAYMYMPAQNMAMKMNFGKAHETVGESPTEQSGSVTQYNPATIGSEVLDGKSCLVAEYTADGTKVKMWVWTKYGLPIKTESTTAQGASVVELKNIELGDIADSMFELPADVRIMEIPLFGL